MQEQLGNEEFPLFLTAMAAATPVSVRFHPLKCRRVPPLNSVPWCPGGRYLPQRPVFTLDPCFHAGSYYVQEASSMVIWEVLNQVINKKKGLRILDLCAAPGGKSTLLADYFQEDCLLVSNEIIRNRAMALRDNVIKSGYANILVSQNTPEEIGRLHDFFDIILVDAPCSGEGMFRKDADACHEWSPEAVKACAFRQEEILKAILPALKENGVLLFSTCTFNDMENLGSMDFLSEQDVLENIRLTLPEKYNIVSRQSRHAEGYQFYPHKLEGEGFFITAFRKKNEGKKTSIPKGTKSLQIADHKHSAILENQWCRPGEVNFIHDKAGNTHILMKECVDDALTLSAHLRLMHCGVNAGSFQKEVFIPHHNLALSHWASQKIPTLDLDKNEALHFLKREAPVNNSELKGWHRVRYVGECLSLHTQASSPLEAPFHPIGWAKNIGNRWNNYLPAEYRIRMELQG